MLGNGWAQCQGLHAKLTESFLRERSFFIFPPAARMLTLFSPPRYPRQLEEPQKHFWASLLWGDTKGGSTTAQAQPQPALHLPKPGMGMALHGKASENPNEIFIPKTAAMTPSCGSWKAKPASLPGSPQAKNQESERKRWSWWG